MKKSVVSVILGLGLAAVSTTAFGQGGIVIGNYQGAYNAVVWAPNTPRAGLGVLSSEGVDLTLNYGPSAALGNSVALSWNLVNQANGFPGFYGIQTISLPGWSAGQTWSFQIVASGNGGINGQSVVWTENANINNIGGTPAGTPGSSSQSIGFQVNIPEPTTFALAGLGAATMLIVRRRRS
jgi:hypothetical protein